ncbi:hypothetical protein ACFX13_030585 [Malus domestica]
MWNSFSMPPHVALQNKRTREVALEVTRTISESLGLEPSYIHDAMNMDRGIQIVAANYYPPCPQLESNWYTTSHDHGLFTLLIQNKMNGLQVEHNGKWLTVNGPANGFFVNLADQMQIQECDASGNCEQQSYADIYCHTTWTIC